MAGQFDQSGMWDGARVGRVAWAPGAAADPIPEPGPAVPCPWLGAPGVHWRGVFAGYTGYAKANREIALRLAHSMRVCVAHVMDAPDPDAYARARVAAHRSVVLPPTAPYVRFMGPAAEGERRHRVIWTMMETEAVHPEMVRLINGQYDECWTPTAWNARTFRDSGVRVPVRVMPLGVDPVVYSPRGAARVPEATLLTGPDAGRRETPRGALLLVYVLVPTFRKGLDVLLPAFEEALGAEPEAGLVLAVTHGSLRPDDLPEGLASMRGRVWALGGALAEWQMAALYRGCAAYVCSSRGEGWNLPLCEAAACGLPVVAPRHTGHNAVINEGNALTYDADGIGPHEGARRVSPWYDGMPFSLLGPKAREGLVAALRTLRDRPEEARRRAALLSASVRTDYTWDHAARRVAERLLELQA